MKPKRVTLPNAGGAGTASEAVLIDWRKEDFNLAGYISASSSASWEIQATGEVLPDGSDDFSNAAWHSLASGNGSGDFVTTQPCTGLRVTLGTTAVDAITLDLVQAG